MFDTRPQHCTTQDASPVVKGCFGWPMMCAFHYPLLGLRRFVANPSLFLIAIVPYMIVMLSSAVFGFFLLSFTWKYQTAFLEKLEPVYMTGSFWHVFNKLIVMFVILGESAMFCFLLMGFAFSSSIVEIMHAVFEQDRYVSRISGTPPAKLMPRGIACIRIGSRLPKRLAMMVATLPLQSWPILGQIAWFAINGWFYSWDLLGDWLPSLEEASEKKASQEEIQDRHVAIFVQFGAVALALTFVPVVGPLFYFTNACGAMLLFEELADRRSNVSCGRGGARHELKRP